MTASSGINWEDAFANADHIPNGMAYPEIWATRAKAFRAAHRDVVEIAYGDHPRERLDLFMPAGTPKGLAMIVHGGFWLAFDNSSWSDLAEGALRLGWAVALPSYTLAPEATIPDISNQIARVLETSAAKIGGPIRLTGHSAGGHLVTRMACKGSPLDPAVAARIERVVSISGLHDLRPLMLHSMNEKLGLTEESAIAESAALQSPLPHIKTTAWVGASERPEFLRQSALLAEAWGIELVADPDKHHFDVIEGLKHPDHPLCQAFAGA